VRRIQVYLDDNVWDHLRATAHAHKTSVSALVREILREHNVRRLEKRKRAMLAIIGIRKDRTDIPDSTKYVRELRRGIRRTKALDLARLTDRITPQNRYPEIRASKEVGKERVKW